jgi:hypothetical protein
MKIILAIGLIYFIYTLRFAIKFNRKQVIFNKQQKLFHNIFIWLIPFIWIILLKTLMKPLPRSNQFKGKVNSKNTSPYEERNPDIFGEVQ